MELIAATNNQLTAAALHTVQAVERMAQVAVESRLFGEIKTEAQAFALMLLCQAKGLHPMAAMERYHVINNRPTMKADAMLAEFQAAGGRVQWEERTDQRAAATFDHPAGGRVTIVWDMARATRAGLTNKDTWRKHPGQMLAARVVSEGVRAVLPGVIIGIYTPEEAINFEPLEPATGYVPQQSAAPLELVTPPEAETSAADAEAIAAREAEATLQRAEMQKWVDAFKGEANKRGYKTKEDFAELKALLYPNGDAPDPKNSTAADYAEAYDRLNASAFAKAAPAPAIEVDPFQGE
jgi:hypothetical protein